MTMEPVGDVSLSASETARFTELVATVHRGQQTFREVGTALEEIKESRLYRETHSSFEAYVLSEFGLTRGRAYQLVETAAITTELSKILDTPLPANEAQAHELLGLSAGEAASVMRTAAEAGPVTARSIRTIVCPTEPREANSQPDTELVAAKIKARLARWTEQLNEIMARDDFGQVAPMMRSVLGAALEDSVAVIESVLRRLDLFDLPADDENAADGLVSLVQVGDGGEGNCVSDGLRSES